MNPSREELLFQLALSKPAAKRAAWLDTECDGDAALRQRLEALLAAQADTVRPTIELDLSDTPDEAVGQTLGRYKLREQIGEGGCVARQFGVKRLLLFRSGSRIACRLNAVMMRQPHLLRDGGAVSRDGYHLAPAVALDAAAAGARHPQCNGRECYVAGKSC